MNLPPDVGKDWRPRGLIAASVTPFHDDFTVDLDRLTRHVDWLIGEGVDGVAVVAGCGEYVSLTAAERGAVIEAAIDAAGGRVGVVVGALAPSTLMAIETGQAAARFGAVALLVTPPYYIRPSLDGVLSHFRAVHDATGLPVIAYNNPPRVGWDIGRDELAGIAALPGVVGVKDCDRDLASIAAKLAALPPEFSLLSGDDDLGFGALLAGAVGGVWATPNIAPRRCRRLMDACLAGDVAGARIANRDVLPLVELWQRPNHPGPLKELMAMCGRGVGPARPPLAPLTPTERQAAERALHELGPID